MNQELEQQLIDPHEQLENVIVTGGTEGIGRAIALELSSQEHDVVICARTQEKLESMKRKNNIEACQLDLADIDRIDEFIRKGSEKMGGVSVLILNAAVSGITESEDYTFRVNLDAQKTLVKSAANELRNSNGRIVFLTSSQAENPIEDNLAYGQSKKDMDKWLHEFSIREENKNIQVFSINPGPTDTRMHEEAIKYGKEGIRDRSLRIKNEGGLRDPYIVGRIISKVSMSGKKFNPKTNRYDTPIYNNEVITITDENIKFENTGQGIHSFENNG